MKTPASILCLALLVGCVTVVHTPSFVGTWKMTDQIYYLRIYANGQAAIWPSPPDGQTGWTVFRDGKLAFGGRLPLHDPKLSIRASNLVMHTDTMDQIFIKVVDIDPP